MHTVHCVMDRQQSISRQMYAVECILLTQYNTAVNVSHVEETLLKCIDYWVFKMLVQSATRNLDHPERVCSRTMSTTYTTTSLKCRLLRDMFDPRGGVIVTKNNKTWQSISSSIENKKIPINYNKFNYYLVTSVIKFTNSTNTINIIVSKTVSHPKNLLSYL